MAVGRGRNEMAASGLLTFLYAMLIVRLGVGKTSRFVRYFVR